MESLFWYLDNFLVEILIFFGGLLLIIIFSFLVTWFYNKKKYQLLKHQIPAVIVRDYIDSIIQNSSALKSSLFRVDQDGIPAVMRISNLDGGSSVALGVNESIEISKKNAEIASLQQQLEEKNRIIKDLEKSKKDKSSSEMEIKFLEGKLKEAEEALSKKIEGSVPLDVKDIASERDELKLKLQEYAAIEDDLVNLKKLKQENAKLRKLTENTQVDNAKQEVLEEAPIPLPEELNIQDDKKSFEDFINLKEEISLEEKVKETTSILEENKEPEEVKSQEEPPKEEVKEKKQPKQSELLLDEFEQMLKGG